MTNHDAPKSQLDRLVAAATILSDVELHHLREAIDRLDRERRAIVLHPNGKAYKLIRLDDGQFFDLHRRSIAIEDSGWFLITYMLDRERAGEGLGLAEAYMALTERTGPSSQHFDDYKCSFGFPFLLELPGAAGNSRYLLEVRDYKGSLEFPIRKIVEAKDPRLVERRIHPPFADEFPREAINELVVYFHAYLIGYWEATEHRAHEAFVHHVPSNLIVYGYQDGRCFEEQFHSHEQYEAALKRYERRIKAN